jgi:ethanolamine utilization protein EutN
MQIARVVGPLVSTRKSEELEAKTLLLVQPVAPDGAEVGPVLLAVDGVGAGVGERVLVVLEGKSAGDAIGRKGAAVDAAIVGIVDAIDEVPTVRQAPDRRRAEPRP